MNESVEFWRAKYESLVARSDSKAVEAAEQIVRSCIEISSTTGLSFGTVHAAMMQHLFKMRGATTRKNRGRK